MEFPIIAKIKDKLEIAKGTLMVTLDLQGKEVDFLPGQYFFVELINPPYPDDRGARRHFSINNSPNQKGALVFTTRLRDSGFKKSIKELELGTEVKVTSLSGKFVLPQDSSKPLAFIAGGIGITPYISMIRYIKEENLPFKITLLYSNKSKEETAYFDELSKLDSEMDNLKVVFTMTQDVSWKGEKSRINSEFIKKYTDVSNSLYYVVGPPAMVEAVSMEVLKAGVSEERLKIENFTGY